MDTQYAAGAMDSDGHITIRKAKRSYVVHVGFTNCFKPLVDEFQQSFGGSVHYANQAVKKENHRPTWVWAISNQKAVAFLKSILPHLRVKKEQAILCIELQERIARHLSEHGRPGRPKKGENKTHYLPDDEFEARRQLHDRCVALKHVAFYPE